MYCDQIYSTTTFDALSLLTWPVTTQCSWDRDFYSPAKNSRKGQITVKLQNRGHVSHLLRIFHVVFKWCVCVWRQLLTMGTIETWTRVWCCLFNYRPLCTEGEIQKFKHWKYKIQLKNMETVERCERCLCNYWPLQTTKSPACFGSTVCPQTTRERRRNESKQKSRDILAICPRTILGCFSPYSKFIKILVRVALRNQIAKQWMFLFFIM